MYKLTDVVEMGHSLYTGGSIAITFTFNSLNQGLDKAAYLGIMDHLDHCLVTTNPEASKFNGRYFVLSSSENLFEDVITIMEHLIVEKQLPAPDYISVGLEKEWYERTIYRAGYGSHQTVVEYNVKD
jgi:hypothetical protein